MCRRQSEREKEPKGASDGTCFNNVFMILDRVGDNGNEETKSF